MPRSGFTTSTPVPLYWVSHGPEGGERLLVIHGGPGAHHDYLLPQMLDLAKEREVILYDQRGGGRSRHDDDRAVITADSHISDLAAVVRDLAIDPLTLVGYSWGALLALLYAVRASHNRSIVSPARLVLIDPAPASRAWRMQFEEEFARRQQSPAVQALRAELAASGQRESNPDAYRQRTFELSIAGYFADPARARHLTPFRVTGRVQQSVWESLGDFDLVHDLRAVHCPAIVIHGRQDPIPLASSEAIADTLRAPCVVLENCGHVPYVEQPEALFGNIRNFLGRTPLPG